MKTTKLLGVYDGCWVITGWLPFFEETSFSWLLLDTNVSSDAISHLLVHLSSFWPTCKAEGNEVRQFKIEPILYSNLMQASTLVCDLLHHAMNKSLYEQRYIICKLGGKNYHLFNTIATSWINITTSYKLTENVSKSSILLEIYLVTGLDGRQIY